MNEYVERSPLWLLKVQWYFWAGVEGVLPMSWLYRRCLPVWTLVRGNSYGAWERWRMRRDGLTTGKQA